MSDLTTAADTDTLMGSANFAAWRTSLGLVIGTDVQAFDSDLAAIAALTTTAFGRSFLALADAAAARTLTGLVIGTNVQAFDSDLAAIAALTTTSFGRSFLELSDASAALTLAGTPVNNIVTDATTARTLGLTDAAKYIRFTNAGAITLTVPTNAVTAIPIGSEVVIRRHTGAGVITLSNAGVTVNNSALPPTVPVEGNFALKKIATDEWDAI